MKMMLACLALAGTLLAGVPVAAQPYYPSDRRDFWYGAPSGAWERVSYLQQRIDRGRADGTLTKKEARRAQSQLDDVRRDASRMRSDGLSQSESRTIRARLDEVSRNIRWSRTDDDVRESRYYDQYRTDYDASRYYRDGRYEERVLTENDQIYRGSDGRYYCKRPDGTTGLIVGAGAGALLGGIVSDGVGGALIGGALGGLLGRQIDRNRDDIRCR